MYWYSAWPSSIWCWGASSGTCTCKQNGAISCRAREEGASTIHVHMQAESSFPCSSFPNSACANLASTSSIGSSCDLQHARSALSEALSPSTLCAFDPPLFLILCLLHSRAVASSLPNTGRRGFSCCCCFRDSVPSLRPGLEYKNIGEITEGNHVQGNLF